MSIKQGSHLASKINAFINNFFSGHCTLWFDSLLGVDYSLSCLAHDISYRSGILDKVIGDLELLLDVWYTAQVHPSSYGRAILRLNAIAMYIGVSTFGWIAYAKGCAVRWLDKQLDFLQTTAK